MINRTLLSHVQKLSQQFRALAIMGPRQSGKTTLARMAFPDHAYITLEDIDKRALAQEDPRGFLAAYDHHPGIIIDEVQTVPSLLS
jgi:hypothetical protein